MSRGWSFNNRLQQEGSSILSKFNRVLITGLARKRTCWIAGDSRVIFAVQNDDSIKAALEWTILRLEKKNQRMKP